MREKRHYIVEMSLEKDQLLKPAGQASEGESLTGGRFEVRPNDFFDRMMRPTSEEMFAGRYIHVRVVALSPCEEEYNGQIIKIPRAEDE